MTSKDLKKAALQYWRTVYWEKWRGATIKSIVMSSFEAGYKYAKGDDEQ